jgi:ABC-type glutathione transport system ATPase component
VARLLMRLLRPDRGTMVLDGDPVDEPHGITINELRRQVQMVFQDSYASLNPRLTIVETLAFAPKAHGLPAAEARAPLARPAGQGRARSQRLRRPLSARAVGRPAPAREHRPRARLAARAWSSSTKRCRRSTSRSRRRC